MSRSTPSSSAAQTGAVAAASMPTSSVNNAQAANLTAPAPAPTPSSVSSNIASNPLPGTLSTTSGTVASSAQNVVGQAASLSLAAIPRSYRASLNRAASRLRNLTKSAEAATEGLSRSVENVFGRGRRSASFHRGHDLESTVQAPNAQPSGPVAGLSKLFEAPAISSNNLVQDFDDSSLKAEFDSLSLTISKDHACLDNSAYGVYEIKELWIEENKISYNCPTEYRWHEVKRRWAYSYQRRLIGDLRAALRSLEEGTKKDRNFRPNLRMAGWAESSAVDVHLQPTVVIRCATEKGRKAIDQQLSALEYVANINRCVFVGLDELNSMVVRTVPSDQERSESVEMAPDVDEHWHSRVAKDLDIRPWESCNFSSCGWKVYFQLRNENRYAISTVGGFLLVNGIPYGITAGHPIYQLLDPEDDISITFEHTQHNNSLPGAPETRVDVAAMDFAAAFLTIDSSGDHPSPDPTSDFALLAVDQTWNTKRLNMYQPRHSNGIPISIQKIDENPSGGNVDVIVGKDQIRRAVLEQGASYFVQDDVMLHTQTLHLDAPLAPGSSGAWVIQDNRLLGYIVSISVLEKTAQMLPIALTIKSIEELFTRAGLPKPSISLPVYSSSSRSPSFEQTLSTSGVQFDDESLEHDDNSILPSSVLALASNKDDRPVDSSKGLDSITNKDILEEFASHLASWRRSTFDGCYFYDVSALKVWMEAKYDETIINLDQLLLEIHNPSTRRRTFPLNRTHVLDVKEQSVIVVAILLSAGLGYLFDSFWVANVRDSNLAHISEWIGSLKEQLGAVLNQIERDAVIETFQKAIPQFTPVQITFRMRDRFGFNHVLPFYKKERVNDKGGRSIVYKVALREENLSPLLRDLLRASRYMDPEFGPSYTMALKTYPESRRNEYEAEEEALTQLNEAETEEFILRCLGSYRCVDADGDITYNLLLEWAQLDLDEYFLEMPPPSTSDEITAFWGHIFKTAEALRLIHNLRTFRGSDYTGVHGDIKPENIMMVDGKFKIADFGFARFKRNSPDNIPMVNIPGGTLTYAPPDDYGSNLEGREAWDMWGYGAVLLITATWVVLGQIGLLQFEKLRMLYVTKLGSADLNGRSHRVPLAVNSFHDGVNCLPVIHDWAQFLQRTMRKSDHITWRVIDMVTNSLLVDEKERISSKELCACFRRILDMAMSEQRKLSEMDSATIAEAILAVNDSLKDSMAGVEVPSLGAPLTRLHSRSSGNYSSRKWRLPKERYAELENRNRHHLALSKTRTTPTNKTDSHPRGSVLTPKILLSEHNDYRFLPSENHHLLRSEPNSLLSPLSIPESTRKYRTNFSLESVPRVKTFVDRPSEMAEIERVLLPQMQNTRQRIFVLHGLGGIGKTQLAVEFARRYHPQFDAVIWLDGRSKYTLERSIVSCAGRIPRGQIPEKSRAYAADSNGSVDTVVKDVMDWLARPDNKAWLLIFDNVSHAYCSQGGEPDAYDVKQYFSRADHGNVLITTRLARLAQLGESQRLGRVDEEQALAIFESWYETKHNSDKIKPLLELLDGLPLAIAQAAGYLRETGISLATYIKFYEHRWSELMDVKNDAPLQDYPERSLWITWAISYETIRNTHQPTAHLLLLWSFLDNKDLWYSLIAEGCGKSRAVTGMLEDWIKDIATSELAFNQAIQRLRNYSLIEEGERTESYAMHPVLHRWVRHYLGKQFQAELQQLAIVVVGWAVPSSFDPDYLAITSRLIPHAQQSIGEIRTYSRNDEKANTSEAVLDATSRLGFLLQEQNQLYEAEAMYQQALRGYEEIFGHMHTSTLGTISGLGDVYRQQHKLYEAEKTYMQARQGFEKVLGSEHPLTLGTLNNLGSLYIDLNSLDKAETVYLQALQGFEKVLGPEHRSTLDTHNHLGNLYANLNMADKAIYMYQRALEGFQKILGPNHPQCQMLRTNLTSLHAKQKEVERPQAEPPAHKQAVESISTTSTLTEAKSALKRHSRFDKLRWKRGLFE